MLNLESKKNHFSNPEMKQLPSNDLAKNNDSRSIFTLYDGIKLLQSNKNASIEQIIKLPTLKISNVKKNNNEKTNSSKEKNLLNINSIKGKSIFNNSILDNVLGTINVHNDHMQKSFFVKNSYNNIFNKTNNLIKENSHNFIESNTFFKPNKTILDLKSEFINSNNIHDNNETNKYENIDGSLKINNNNDIDRNTKNNLENKKVVILNKKISSADNTLENFPLLTMDSNFNKRNNYSNNLRLLNEMHHSLKSNSRSKLINNVKLYDDKEKTEITNNNTNNNFNLLNNINSTIYKSSNNTNLINIINTQNNSSGFFSTTMQNYNQVQPNCHNKEYKFELYKQNKIQEFNGNYTSNFFINHKNITFDINRSKIELNKSNHNNNFNNNGNLILNLDMNSTSRTIVIEASTQTKCNLSALDDKNSSIISDKEHLSNTLNENFKKNKNTNNIRVLNDDAEDFFEIKENNKQENFHHIFNKEIFNNGILENELINNNAKNNKKIKKQLSDSTMVYDTNMNDYNHSKSKVKDFNIDNKSSKFECNIFKMKDIRKNHFNRTNKFNNQIIQNNNPVTYIKKNKFLSPIQSNNDKSNSNVGYGFNNSPIYSNSTNLIYKKISNLDQLTKNDFNKEIFRNSKILRENYITSYKNKKKSQTCYIGDNSTSKKLANIKYSKNVQM